MKNTRITSDDLLIEIFKRFPRKTLSRFRCVSKHWNLLFRRPDFATVHFDYSKAIRSAAPAVLFSVSQGSTLTFFIVNEQGEARHHLTIDTLNFGFKWHRFPLFINGILCLFDHVNLLVCNIATGEIISIPPSNIAIQYWYGAQYFFGFDPVKNEYKVLCVRKNDQDRKTAEAEVFTVGISKKWRTIDTQSYYIYNPQNYTLQSVYANGNIYWVSDYDDGKKTGLVSFDVREEKFKVTRLRKDLHLSFARPVRYKGDLAFVQQHVIGRSEILCEFDYDGYSMVGFKEGFRFPRDPSHLVITSDLDSFFIFERDRYGELELSYYDEDGSIIRSSKITGLEEAGYWWVCQARLRAAIHEHVENIYPLARI